jgi:hypothetical protein
VLEERKTAPKLQVSAGTRSAWGIHFAYVRDGGVAPSMPALDERVNRRGDFDNVVEENCLLEKVPGRRFRPLQASVAVAIRMESCSNVGAKTCVGLDVATDALFQQAGPLWEPMRDDASSAAVWEGVRE